MLHSLDQQPCDAMSSVVRGVSSEVQFIRERSPVMVTMHMALQDWDTRWENGTGEPYNWEHWLARLREFLLEDKEFVAGTPASVVGHWREYFNFSTTGDGA